MRFGSLWRHPLLFAIALAATLAVGGSAVSRAEAVCVGDCDGDGTVRIAEAQRCVNLANGLPADACPNADQDRDGTVAPGEVDLCLKAFRDSSTCAMVFTPAPTHTNTLPPTNTKTPLPTNTAPATSTVTAPPPTATNTRSPSPTPTATEGSLGKHDCTVDTGSKLTLLASLPLSPLPVNSGSVAIDCGAVGADGNAACSCSVNTPGFNALSIAGIFWACVKPAVSGACPVGKIDCDGGSQLGLTLTGNRKIGTCTSNNDCTSKCATHCGGAQFVFTGKGQCEGFCTDGAQSACLTDAGCLGLGQGSCNGPDNVGLGNICDCTCLDSGAGSPGPAGTMQCQLAFNLTVESIPGNGKACDGADVTITIGDTCAPLTTSAVSAIENNPNNGGPPPFGPFDATGTAGSCAALQSGDTSAIAFRGATQFYASTIGDILTGLALNCK